MNTLNRLSTHTLDKLCLFLRIPGRSRNLRTAARLRLIAPLLTALVLSVPTCFGALAIQVVVRNMTFRIRSLLYGRVVRGNGLVANG